MTEERRKKENTRSKKERFLLQLDLYLVGEKERGAKEESFSC